MKKVIFLDDDHDLTEMMIDVFEGTNFNLQTFNNALDALGYIETNHVDCIMTDLNMSRMDGFEFYQKLKDKKNTCPVILISGHVDKTMISKALALGFNEIVEKPFDHEVLLENIERITS